MPFYLALDVGGTKTDLVLADDDHVLARTRTGSLKRLRTDASAATQFLDTALAQLTAQTGVDLRAIRRTCVGTAGNTVPLVTDWLRSALTARVGGDLLILGDVEIALDAAFPGQPGILVLAGTGSNVAGRGAGDGAATGPLLTVGGWGPALSDEGSGFRIGQAALRAVTRAHDAHGTPAAQQPTTLLPAILAFWGLASFSELVSYANGTPAPDVSRLVETVVRCADAGDTLAQTVLQQAGEELAELVLLLLARLSRTNDPSPPAPRFAFAGSIMENVPAVRRALLATVRRSVPAAQELPGVVDPVLGALWRARAASF